MYPSTVKNGKQKEEVQNKVKSCTGNMKGVAAVATVRISATSLTALQKNVAVTVRVPSHLPILKRGIKAT